MDGRALQSVVGERRDPKEILAKELFWRLCNDLHRRIKNDPNYNKDVTEGVLELSGCMLEYSKQEFAKKFRFEYEGNLSKPPNMKKGGRVVGYEELFHLPTFPATKHDVENWMDTELFQRTDRIFPEFAMGNIYDDIRDNILRCGSAEGNPVPNVWGTVAVQQVYRDPTSYKRDIQRFSHFLYIHNDLTLDLPNGAGEGRIERLFVYFLGVFSSYEP